RGAARADNGRRAGRLAPRAHAPARREEIVDVARLERAERDVVAVPVREVVVGRTELALLPQLDGPAAARGGIRERAPRQDVVPSELIAPDDAPALAHPDLPRGVGHERVREARPRQEERCDGERAPAALALGRREEVVARGALLGDAVERQLADDLAGIE